MGWLASDSEVDEADDYLFIRFLAQRGDSPPLSKSTPAPSNWFKL